MNEEFNKKFLTNTDETGRFVVTSKRTGKIYYVEAIDNGHRSEWGSIDPASKNLMHKRGDGKYKGSVKPNESLITLENGFSKVHELDPGTSPLLAIDHIDAQYPDKE